MKYLQIVNAFMTALGVAFGVILAVVCLLYGMNLELHPRLREDLPLLFGFTAACAALGAAAGTAFVAQRRRWPVRWLLQALPLGPLAAVAALLLTLRG